MLQSVGDGEIALEDTSAFFGAALVKHLYLGAAGKIRALRANKQRPVSGRCGFTHCRYHLVPMLLAEDIERRVVEADDADVGVGFVLDLVHLILRVGLGSSSGWWHDCRVYPNLA